MPEPPNNPLVRKHVRFNRSTNDNWASFTSHRREIEKLIAPDAVEPGAGAARRLCVLGAGNCNDLDLPALAEAFGEVHLVDIDPAALARAVRRQGVEGSPAVRLHAPVDLTGVAELRAAWSGKAPSPADVDACVAAAPQPDLPGPFDVVLSPCVLSQLTGYAIDLLGKPHPRYRELLLAVRDRHLRLLADLVAPGGAGVLVCDVLCSDSCPGLASTKRTDLPELLRRRVRAGKSFPGLEPGAVESFFKAEPTTAPLLGGVQIVRPWVWEIGPGRTFLVYGLRFRKLHGPVILGGAAHPSGKANTSIIVPGA